MGRPAIWAASAGASPVFLLILAGAHCAVPPAEDCSAKSTCMGGDAAAPPGLGEDASVWIPTDSPSSGGDASPITPGSDAQPVPDPLLPCGLGYVCVPPVPEGFMGPVALWTGAIGVTAPDCPMGYGWPTDNYADLSGADAGCTCTCAATGQECVASATIYSDMKCTAPCATSAVASACSTVAGCNEQGSLRANLPVPQGGACVPSVAQTVTHAAWVTSSRMCPSAIIGGEEDYYCPSANDICAAIPAAPFQTRPCIAAIVPADQTAPTTCPAAYPYGPMMSYWYVADSRGCSPCTCGASPVGGSCAGTISITGANTSDCTTGANTSSIGAPCTPFALPDSLAHIAGNYAVTPGRCSIGTDTHAEGNVRPTGPTQVVCCL